MPVMRSNCGFPYTQKPQHEPFGEKFKSKKHCPTNLKKQLDYENKLNYY